MKKYKEIDFKHDDFDPYRCWEEADCQYVEEVCIGNPEDEDIDEYLCCSAPYDFVCPLYEKIIQKDLNCDII